MFFKEFLTQAYEEAKALPKFGQVAQYIPELAKVNPDKFGVYLTELDGTGYGVGDYQEIFSIQSIAKVFSLTLAMSLVGKDLWGRVDVEPSGNAFNSLIQLETEAGIPRNPFINAGALVVCDVLMSQLQNPKHELLQYIRDIAGLPGLEYSIAVAESEASEGYRNRALINFMKDFDNIHNPVEEVLDLYFHLSSISMTCQELSRAFLYLANYGKQSASGETLITTSQAKRINAIMQMCGFYDEAGEFAYCVGLPGKSGVGGGIIAVHPGKYSIAVWSPPLNERGNSYRGMRLLETFTTLSQTSIF